MENVSDQKVELECKTFPSTYKIILLNHVTSQKKSYLNHYTFQVLTQVVDTVLT